LRVVAIARDVISDVLRRWGPLGFYSARGLRGGSFTTIAPLRRGEFRVHLDANRWTTDTSVTGELETSQTRGTMNGSVVVSAPTVQARFEILASHILAPSSHETFFGTIHGHEVDLTFDAKFGG
jgi:hypothetical protein